jgi:hypothetical protein
LSLNWQRTLLTNSCVAGTSKGFFESSVGAQFATRSESPKKPAPKQAAPTKASSGGFFDSSVGSQFATRSESPKKAAPKQAAPTKASSGGFFESSVGAQFANRTQSPKKAAPKQAAPTRASSGGGFFDSSVGSQFATKSAKAAPKQAASTASASGKLFCCFVSWQLSHEWHRPLQACLVIIMFFKHNEHVLTCLFHSSCFTAHASMKPFALQLCLHPVHYVHHLKDCTRLICLKVA